MKRRSLLMAGASGAAAALGGCAVWKREPPHVVVVGAGFGGATAARYLKLWGGKAAEVTLVERDARFVSCPLSNLVLAGWRNLNDLTRGHEGLTAAGVRVVHAEAAGIDAAARKLRLADGTQLAYERLVIAPGVDFDTAGIPGLDAALASGRVLHAWKAGPQTAALRAQLEALPEGGVVAISIPRAPYRCPPGPYERACVVAAWLKANKPRAKLLLLDANAEVQSKKALFERAFAERYADVLEYRPNSELREVDAAAGVLKFDFDDVKADVLNVIPPQRAGRLAADAGLATINRRWAGVDWLTMESTAAPRIHLLGDAVFPGPAMPKSGHMANQHGKLAASAILQLLAGDPPNPAPTVMNTCYSFVGVGEAVHIASVHRYDAAQKGFVPVAGAGGVSPSASAAEGQQALAWAQGIWADTLG